MLFVLPIVCIKVFNFLYISDLKSLFEVLPKLKYNLTNNQKKKIDFFDGILKKKNSWNSNLIDVFYKLVIEIQPICYKENFLRIMSAESIFEHSFYCCQKSTSIIDSCKKCVKFYTENNADETCFYLNEIERAIYVKYFKSEMFQAELKCYSPDFLNPFPVRTMWLSSSRKAYTHADNLVRRYCITAQRLFCNFFLNSYYLHLLKESQYPYTQTMYRHKVFTAASRMTMYLVMNLNFEFFDFFAQNAHPGTDYNCRDINIRNQFLDQFNKEQAEFCKNFSNVLDRKERFIKQYRKSLFDKI